MIAYSFNSQMAFGHNISFRRITALKVHVTWRSPIEAMNKRKKCMDMVAKHQMLLRSPESHNTSDTVLFMFFGWVCCCRFFMNINGFEWIQRFKVF